VGALPLLLYAPIAKCQARSTAQTEHSTWHRAIFWLLIAPHVRYIAAYLTKEVAPDPPWPLPQPRPGARARVINNMHHGHGLMTPDVNRPEGRGGGLVELPKQTGNRSRLRANQRSGKRNYVRCMGRGWRSPFAKGPRFFISILLLFFRQDFVV
jgi:hypothetical protein